MDKIQTIPVGGYCIQVGESGKVVNDGTSKKAGGGGGGSEAGLVNGDIGTKEVQQPKLTAKETAELKQTREELSACNQKIKINNKLLNNLEATIMELQSKIEEELAQAIEESEEIEQESKEESERIVREKLNEYTNSNGEMTYEEFLNNVSSELNSHAKNTDSLLTPVVKNMIESNKLMTKLNGNLGTMKKLMDSNKELATQAQEKQGAIEELANKVNAATGAEALEKMGEKIDGGKNKKGADAAEKTEDFQDKYDEHIAKYKELAQTEAQATANIASSRQEMNEYSARANNQAALEVRTHKNIFKQDEKTENNK